MPVYLWVTLMYVNVYGWVCVVCMSLSYMSVYVCTIFLSLSCNVHLCLYYFPVCHKIDYYMCITVPVGQWHNHEYNLIYHKTTVLRNFVSNKPSI